VFDGAFMSNLRVTHDGSVAHEKSMCSQGLHRTGAVGVRDAPRGSAPRKRSEEYAVQESLEGVLEMASRLLES
jgi:hypothetical protein